MAKRSNSKPGPSGAETPKDPKAPFDKYEPSPGSVRTIRSKEAVEELKRFGAGWDAETESLLRLPDELVRLDTGTTLNFSKGQAGGLSSALAHLEGGSLPPALPDYCITVYGTASSVYFVLCDMERRIFVREKIECIHDPVPQKDWAAVRQRIKEAEAAAAGAGEKGMIALSDGTTRLVRLSEETA